MAITAAQLTSMRATATGLMPDICLNLRTLASCPVWLYSDTREHHLPGASVLVRMRRWVLEMPDGTPVQRYDTLVLTSMGNAMFVGPGFGPGNPGPSYWVAEVKSPASYSLSTEALCWQLTDVSGLAISPISANATVTCLRQGTQIATGRRVRWEPSAPGNVTPTGERVPTAIYDSPSAPWKLNDVCRIDALDGFTSLPHPRSYRCQEPEFIAEPPAYVVVELEGEGGTQ